MRKGGFVYPVPVFLIHYWILRYNKIIIIFIAVHWASYAMRIFL